MGGLAVSGERQQCWPPQEFKSWMPQTLRNITCNEYDIIYDI